MHPATDASSAFAKAAELKRSVSGTQHLRGGESVEAKEARIMERAEQHFAKQKNLWTGNAVADLIKKTGLVPELQPSWASADPNRLNRLASHMAEQKHWRRTAQIRRAADRILGREEVGR